MKLTTMFTGALLAASVLFGADAGASNTTAPTRAKASSPSTGAAALGAQTEAAKGQVFTRTFAELGAGQGPLRLPTWQSGYTLKLPLSPRENVTSVRVRLETANSTALIKSRSALSVRVNGRVIAQYPLDPQDSVKTRELEIPVEWLKYGYNDIFFEAIQHYTYECEDPASPELWTEINTLQSAVSVTVDGVRPHYTPKLSQLAVAFDKRGWLPRPLAIVGGTEQVNEAQLAAAALAVQGVALRMGYRPLELRVLGASAAAARTPEETGLPGLSQAVTQGQDVLMVGTRAELSRYLNSQMHQAVGKAGPFVGVFPADEGRSVVLVVSGNDVREVMAAARAVADPDFKFNDVAMESIVQNVGLVAPVVATVDKAVYFHNFGFRTTGSRGLRAPAIPFEFRAPADYGAKKGDLATLRLHFAYGAGLRPDSSLKVTLNGQFAVAVPLLEKSGAEYQRYEVKVPAQYVRPGYNTINFEPVFMLHKDKCDMTRDEGLVLTVYEDSTLELPSPTVAPRVPDLERFSQGLWPISDVMRMHLTQRDGHTAAAAVELAALLARKNRAPMEVELSYSPFSTGHMLLVGGPSTAADFLRPALALTNSASWSAQGDHAGVVQALQGGRVVTAFVASQPTVLAQSIRALDEKGLWASLSGAGTVIDIATGSAAVEPARETQEFGAAKSASANIRDWRMFAWMAAGLAAVFTLAFVALATRRSKQRDS